MLENVLLRELQELKINTSKPIKEHLNTYVVNYEGVLGVAVETTYEKFLNEKFNNVNISKVTIKREEANRDVIMLYVNDNKLSKFFIKLCCDFLEDSELVSSKPIEWYNGWKDILGNTEKKKMVFDVVAELKTLLYLNNLSKNPVWNSMEKGTFDISANDGFYEVKASTKKTKEEVTIHNQFQLDSKGLDKPLYIVYCKVEKNDSGDSIDSLFNELVLSGYDCSQVSRYLNEIDYYDGSLGRSEKYIIHEMRAYEVDESFPKINDKSFVNGRFPDNVVKIEYTISLDGLKYTKFI